jgi:hypothetical protein
MTNMFTFFRNTQGLPKWILRRSAGSFFREGSSEGSSEGFSEGSSEILQLFFYAIFRANQH